MVELSTFNRAVGGSNPPDPNFPPLYTFVIEVLILTPPVLVQISNRFSLKKTFTFDVKNASKFAVD